MSKIKVSIVEDNFIISDDIEANLLDLGYTVSGIYTSGKEAIAGIKKERPDILLMDIHLNGEIDGIETMEIIRKVWDIPFIYITAFADKHTVKRAIKTQPHAYIVKPFNFANLGPTIETALYNFAAGLRSSPDKAQELANLSDQDIITNEAIYLKEKKRLTKLITTDILYLCAKSSYCQIVTKEKDLTISHNLQYMLKKLNSSLFIRIHRSYVVNINEIDSIENDGLFVSGKLLPTSKTYKAALLKKIKQI